MNKLRNDFPTLHTISFTLLFRDWLNLPHTHAIHPITQLQSNRNCTVGKF